MFLALRDIRFARGRFALMGAVVALISTLVVFLYGLTDGLGAASSSAVSGLPADHIVFGAPAGTDAAVSFAESTISAAQQYAWQHAPGVVSADPVGISMTRLTTGGATAAVSMLGAPASLLPPLREGRPPVGGQVAVGSDLAGKHRLTVGAGVTLGSRSMVVGAIVESRGYGHAPTVWTTLDDWQALSRQSGPTVLAVVGAGGSTGQVDAAQNTTAVPLGDALTGIDGYSAEHGSLQLIQGFLFAVSALVIGAFFTLWTVQRRPEIAVLKAIGAGSGYLVRDALAQAATVLCCGALLGGALGAGGGALASGAVPYALSWAGVALPVAAMVLLGLTGAALAVRRITSVDPLTALGANR